MADERQVGSLAIVAEAQTVVKQVGSIALVVEAVWGSDLVGRELGSLALVVEAIPPPPPRAELLTAIGNSFGPRLPKPAFGSHQGTQQSGSPSGGHRSKLTYAN
jgi:hypothetical protein